MEIIHNLTYDMIIDVWRIVMYRINRIILTDVWNIYREIRGVWSYI